VSDLEGKTFQRRVQELRTEYGIRPDSAVDRLVGRLRLPADRRYMAHHGSLGDLRKLGASVQARRKPPPAGAPRVLVMSLRSWLTHCAYESVIAHGLALRGVDVRLMTCGGGQPICEMGFSRHAYPRPCDRCAHYTGRISKAADLPTYRLADTMPWGGDGRRAPAEPPDDLGIDASAASLISALWFLRTANPGKSEHAEPVLGNYRVSAAGVAQAAAAALDDFKPDAIFMVNGLLEGEQVVARLARERGIRIVSYEMGPHGTGLFMTQGREAAAFQTDTAWERFAGVPLTPDQDAAVAMVLDQRARSVGTLERPFEAPGAEVRGQLGLPADIPLVGVFPNMTYDSAALFKDIAYPSLIEWVLDLVEQARDLPLALVIRSHPAEARWGSNDNVEQAVRERFPDLPANVRVVSAASPFNTYDLLRGSSLVMAYASTVGLEASTSGVPVAVAAHTHYRGKGFTIDVETREQVHELLRSLPDGMTPEAVERARRYAFMYFFRLATPFPLVKRRGDSITSVETDGSRLEPGREPYLDYICDRILDGDEFVLPDELVPLGGIE
jgi:hypothetical protein